MEEVPKKLTVNEGGVNLAKQLIRNGQINTQEDGWEFNKPNTDEENVFLAEHEMESYGRWFLAKVEDTDPQTKGHYEFPFGDFELLYKGALIAAKKRAAEFGHTQIEETAQMLLEILEKK